ncbi:MAG: FecR family protein [Treponema sp.]|nr:FecR family protein [Treponema sp.]
MTRQTEQPIATITFKYKAAQRRFADRVLWDRLRKESPVYEGDFIRTAEISEATVTFAGGSSVIDLAENSLIQIHEDNGGVRIDLNTGEVSASVTDSALVLASGDKLITVETGGVVKAGLDGEDIMFRVMEGTASVAGPGGTETVSAGETVALGEAGPQIVREAAALFPRSQARFLSPNPGTFTVPFRWSLSNPSPEELTRLEIAEDRSFSRIVFNEEFTGDTAAVELEPGSYFWRVSLVNDEGTGSSPNTLSFKILSAPAPVLITPVEGYSYQFRVRKPSVRFQWTETAEAAFYILEAADNPEMTNPALSQEVRGTSFYFSGLGRGTWYWRVRPVFSATYEGTAGEGVPASFSIVQRGDLQAPELRSPRNQDMVNVAAGREGIYFSWQPEAEALSYRVRISMNRDLGNPVVDEAVRDNFYVHRAGQNAIRPGQYYWAVSQTDIEGNDSALSPVYSFIALEGDLIQRLSFPPEGYVIEASMLPDIRFTWKTNLPFQTRFQIAGNPGFSSTLVDEAADSEVFQGRRLSEGTWYWRIQAKEAGGTVFETPPRSFTVAPSIAAPLLLEPVPNERAVIQEGDPLVFSWTAPEGAEYYQFKLYYEEDRNNAVYENSLAEGTRQSLSMDRFSDGNYRWTVRGLAPESSRNTRRTGLLSEGVFSAKKLRPVILNYPGNDAGFEGLRAYHEPAVLRWSSVDPVGTSRFILSARSDFTGPPVVVVNNPSQQITLPRLGAGTYYWTIQAESPDGFDISARTPRRFRVFPIPPLPEAVNRLPENGKVIGGAELRANRRIVFSWDAVAGATGYLFTLENADMEEIIMRQGPIEETAFTLEDLTLLNVGTFIWRLEAVLTVPAEERRGETEAIIQRGETGENRFTIDFSLPGTPKLQNPGVLYGKE